MIVTGCPGLQPRDLRLLEVGVDVNRIQRHEAGEPLRRLHVVADLHGAVADHAVEGRLDHREGQIALGLGERGLELLQGARGFFLLRLEHIDVGARRGRWPPRRACTEATAWSSLACACSSACSAVDLARGQVLLALQLELGARRAGLGGGQLRLGLIDRGLCAAVCLAEPIDGGLLHGQSDRGRFAPPAGSRHRRCAR